MMLIGEAGSFSSELIYDWTISRTARNVTVTNRIPHPAIGERPLPPAKGITIVTDEQHVAKVSLRFSAYLLDSDMAGQTPSNVRVHFQECRGA